MRNLVLTFTAALAVMVADQAAAQSNRMRERVREWQTRALESAMGKERAAEALASRSNPEIYGNVARAGRWPFAVALVEHDPLFSDVDTQFCGGTLVDDRFVVTAAHCVTFSNGSAMPTNWYRAVTGTPILSQIGQAGPHRRIEEVAVHPKFKDATANYDIAVLKLTTSAPGKKAAVLTLAQEKTLAFPGDLGYVLGWGATDDPDVPFSSPQLREALVPIVSRGNCNDTNSYNGRITASMMCAGLRGGGRGPCSWDDGGPLIVADALGRFRVLAGVFSWSIDCGQAERYGVYARVAVLRDWIVKTITTMKAEMADDASASCATLRGASQSACLDGLSLAPGSSDK